jgi:4-oxalocrotonate tautomerase
MIHKITETMVGIEGESLRSVTWVLVEEIESGDWGIGGQGITAQHVKDLQAGRV